MSAIAGIWRFDGSGDPDGDCRRMLSALSIYGPDRSGTLVAGEGVALGLCLKFIVPEDRLDHQPLAGPSGFLAADIRLDNRDDLSGQLGLSGDALSRLSDAGLLQLCLDRWDEGALDRIMGDYAFAWWRPERRTLVLARDPLGHRPLFYHRAPWGVAFASMPKGLHALPEVPYAPDLGRLAETLAIRKTSRAQTVFLGMERVVTGHVAHLTPGAITTRRYWNPSPAPLRLRRPDDYVEAFREVFDRSVKAALRGGDDIASLCSGGRDSTSVTSVAARLQAVSGRQVVAFTHAPRLGFDGKDLPGRFGDESSHAALIAARHANIEHHIIRSEGRGPLDKLDYYHHLYDKPIFSPTQAVWAHAIFDAVKARGLKVMLAADTGNATISYDGWSALPQALSEGRVALWLALVVALRRKSGASWKQLANQSFAPLLPKALTTEVLQRSDRLFEIDQYAAITAHRSNKMLKRRLGLGQREPNSFTSRLAWLQRMDRGEEIKALVGGWGVEQRDPTASRPLVEFMLSVPAHEFIRGGVPSSLLRRAMRNDVPREILDEPRAGLQGADWYERLSERRQELSEELGRLAGCEEAMDVVDVARLQAMVRDWPTEGWERPDVRSLYSTGLMRSLVTGHFIRKVVGSNG